MKDEQYTAKGETFVIEEDFSKDGIRRPVVIHVNAGRGDRSGGYDSGFYRSRDWIDRYEPPFGTYTGYVAPWYRKLHAHREDRRSLMIITAVVSPIVVAKLPLLFQLFYQP